MQERIDRPPRDDVPRVNQVVDACGIIRTHVVNHRLHRIAFTVIAWIPVHQTVPTEGGNADV